MIPAMIIVFILGYLGIALEHKTGINKTAVALCLGITLWIMYVFSGPAMIISGDTAGFHEYLSSDSRLANLPVKQQATDYVTNFQIIEHLGDIAEILLYLLGAMTIVEAIDMHGGFNSITERITTKNKKKLLWLIAFITFFMSAVLDNLTTAIIMTMLMGKLVKETKERWLFGSIVIIAANAGGAWTPIGDVTTIMLWIHGNISSGQVMTHLFVPSIVALAIPVLAGSVMLKGQLQPVGSPVSITQTNGISRRQRTAILLLGIASLLSVPVFKSLTGLPPFMGIMLALGIMWIYLSFLYSHKPAIPIDKQFRIPAALAKIDLSSILFFLGILLAVAALEAIGVLGNLSTFLTDKVHNVYLISITIGFLSSVIDNVPLVAAAMGMYPVLTSHAALTATDPQYMMNFIQDGTFWELVAYSAGTGGSILIIGSAAGVVVMGLEKIDFMWYLKHISWLAVLGFLAGMGIYFIEKTIF